MKKTYRIHLLSLSALTLLSLSIFSACDDAPGPSTMSDVVDQSFFRPESFDMMNRPRVEDYDMGGETLGRYGDPCDSDSDCEERVCVSSGDGKVCSRGCILDCDPFPGRRASYCRSDSAQGIGDFFCYPVQNLLCQACLNDTQCDGAPCVETVDGRRCAKVCEDETDCPNEFLCEAGLCTPKSGSCECNADTAGVTRICERGNQFGVCIGEEVCDPESGWSGCSADEPQAEICDGLDQNCDGLPDDGLVSLACTVSNEFGTCDGVSICLGAEGEVCYGDQASEEICDLLDNDCDGVIDEGFTLEGQVYGLDEHCGGCDVSCEGRVPYATSARCDPEQLPPKCIAVECEPGYQTVDGRVCVPAEDVLCEPCADDSACTSRSPGARCVAVGNPEIPETQAQVCARDCGPESLFGEECPEGFECRAVSDEVDAPLQCFPSSGHCLCIGQPEGFSIPCSVTSPVNEAFICSGQRGCEGDRFGACVLPDEVCDGIDNDCDGVIDNQFRSPAGRYEVDPNHCGRCNVSCNQISYANAETVCDRTPETPRCAMRCLEGFIDLENGTDDGCECELLSEVDQPDGVDQNCDGIDGDRAVSLFVSKVGADDGEGSLTSPLSTLSRALELASLPNANIRDIYVATGVYSENITLVNGVSLYGGYSLDFRDRDPEEHPTTILGRPPQGAERGTITALTISQGTTLDGFSIYGSNANVPGGNSVAVFILDSTASLTLSHNQIIAGNGGPGRRGEAGGSGALGRDGARGSDAISAESPTCQDRASDGGAGGDLSCGGADVRGGAGGDGNCPVSQELNGDIPCASGRASQCRNSCDEEPCEPLPPPQGAGEAGRGEGVASGGSPTYDRWSNSGSCSLCGLYPSLPHLGEPGENGPRGVNGVEGAGCVDPRGYLTSDGEWATLTGGSGGAGSHGTGGGGGSAGSGFDVVITGPGCSDNIGAGGGGGGSGGCGGAEGIGGQGGGGSFAILIAYDSIESPETLPHLIENRITRGIGGQGGAGGSGGIGGLGGEGADGGIASGLLCAEPGGRGGNGGNGGHGGGGGGGCGGISVSVYISGSGEALQTYGQLNELVNSGRAGQGGVGGGSTGNPGLSGEAGLVEDVLVVE